MFKTVLENKIKIILCVLIIFLSISSVSAYDSSSDLISSDSTNSNVYLDGSLGENLDDSLDDGLDESLGEGLGEINLNQGNNDYLSEDSADSAIDEFDNNMAIAQSHYDLDNSLTANHDSYSDINSDMDSDNDADIESDNSVKNYKNSKSLNSDSGLKGAGSVIYVSLDGNDIAGRGSLRNPYKTISKAISVANDGDTIFLLNGIYTMNNFFINKNITLMGESQENTILDGEYLNRILSINATDVSLVNLTFRNGNVDRDTDYNGGAINSLVCGYLNITNCSFFNNSAGTHGGAINVMQYYASPEDKRGEIHLYIEGSTFINNTALRMYGGALHIASTAYYGDVYTDIVSSIFINNTGGYHQEHVISVSSGNSTYFNMSSSVIFSDPDTIMYEGEYKTLVYYKQGNSKTEGDGFADVNGNWWGDNFDPVQFNRVNGRIQVDNWIVLNGSVSKSYVVATLNTLKYANGSYEDFDASKLPARLAIYAPSSFFTSSEVELVEGVAKNKFSGEIPQDIIITVDYQNVTVTVEDIFEDYWFIGEVGYKTLEEAIAAAIDGDVIKGVPDLYTPDDLSSEIIIDKNLTITKLDNYAGDYILLNSNHRIFNVLEGVNLNLSNLIFNQGGKESGGLIYINSGASVNINNSIFRKAEASSENANGGAIYSLGNLNITNSQFKDLSASNNGGAIYCEGIDLNIINSSFTNVHASNGGVIYVDGGNLNIENSNFTDSTANYAGAIYSLADSTNINQSIFLNDEANENYWVIYANNNTIIQNSLILNRNNGIDSTSIYISNPLNATLNQNYWGSNSKPNSTKTNVDVSNWIILNLSIDSSLDLIAVNTVHNLTIDFSQYTGENYYDLIEDLPDFGFGLNVLAGKLNQSFVNFNESNVLTVKYTAPNQVQDELISFDDYSDQYLSFYVRGPIVYYWFIGNEGFESLQEAIDAANDGDEIIGIRFNHVYNTTVIVNKSLTIKSNDSSSKATFNGRLLNNEPILYISPEVSVILEDLSFNSATGSDFGGAISNYGNLEIKGSIFNNNLNSNKNGSAIFNNGMMTISSCSFVNNTANYGGAIYNNASLIINGSEFLSNTANYGGAIYNTAILICENSTFTGNKANNEGGAINSQNYIKVYRDIFANNSASSGGAIFINNLDDGSDLSEITYSIFDKNIGNDSSAIAINKGEIKDNFFATNDYSNIIYNISDGSEIAVIDDFRFTLSGPEYVNFASNAEFNIEIIPTSDGVVSELPDYLLNIRITLDNQISSNSFNVNQGEMTFSYIANKDVGYELIELISPSSSLVASLIFNVNPLETLIDLENITMYYGDGSQLIIYLKDSNENILVGRDLKINIDGFDEIIKTTDSEGKAVLDINFDVDSYTGTVEFLGERNYLASNKTFSIDVLLIPTIIDAEDVLMYYNNGTTLDIYLKDIYGNGIFDKEIKILIAGEEFREYSGAQGLISLALNQNPNNYVAKIIFDGDDIYSNASKDVNIDIELMPTVISADNITVYYNETARLVAYLKDIYGNPLIAYELSIKSDDLDYLNFTDNDAKVVLDIKRDIGNYTLNIAYAGNEFYASSTESVTLDVIKMLTEIKVNTIVFRSDEINNLSAYLYDFYENPIENKVLHLEIANQNYSLTTNSIGEVSQLILLDNGNYNLTFGFDGDEYYEAFNITLNFNVFGPSKTIIESKDIYSKEGSVNIIAYLKDSRLEAITDQLLIIKVNNKSYMKITDENGKISLDIALEKGAYPVIFEFAGDDNYMQSNKTITANIIEGDIITVNHTGNDRKDIQDAIDSASPGDLILLGDYDYSNVSDINITKDLIILGDDTSITSAGDGNALFNIPSIADGGPSDVTIRGIDFIVDNGDVLVLANANNGTSPNTIETASIHIEDNTVSLVNDDVVSESVTVLKLNSERGILAPTNEISLTDNTFVAGIDPFEFAVSSVTDGSNTHVPSGGIIDEKLATVIEYEDMTTTAIDASIEPGTGEYFQITLKDSNGNTLANKDVQFGFNGKIYNKTTDEYGIAKLQINLQRYDIYTFAVNFQGDDAYNGSFAVAKITVKKQNPTLTVPNKSYKASAKTKTLTATFKSASGKVVAGKKITFTVNGKTYTATTNDKGVASVNVSLSTKKTYSFTAKFAGDNTYAAITKTAKVTIN